MSRIARPIETPRLRNIGLLLLLSAAFQLVVAVVMAITGLSYSQASSAIVGVILGTLLIAVLYLLIRSRRENIQAARTMRSIKELQAVQQALISKLTTYASNLEDRHAQSEILDNLELLNPSPSSSTASSQEEARRTQPPMRRAGTHGSGNSD